MCRRPGHCGRSPGPRPGAPSPRAAACADGRRAGPGSGPSSPAGRLRRCPWPDSDAVPRERFVGLAEPFHQVLVDWQVDVVYLPDRGDAPGIGDEHAGERPEVPNADMGAYRWQSPAGQGGLDQLHVDAAQRGSSGPDDLPSIEAANIRDAAFGDDRVLTGEQCLVEAAGVGEPLVVTLAEVGGVLDVGDRALIGNRPEPPGPG